MADGQLFKPDKDFTKEADKVIPEAQELAKVALRDTSKSYWINMCHRTMFKQLSKSLAAWRRVLDRYRCCQT